jgi:hypothetical protein
MTAVATLPELGPWLGRLCNATGSSHLARFAYLDDIRVDLANGVIDLAGAARGFSSDDHAAIVGSLRARSIRQLWDKALAAAAARTAAEIDSGFVRAAAESRYPPRRLAKLKVSPTELAAITARLGAGGIPLEQSLAKLDDLAGAAGAPAVTGQAAFARWAGALAAAARQLESAWLSLEEAVDREGTRWQREFEAVRRWTRPVWPLWLITALVLGTVTWLGLVLGGFLPSPAWLRPFAEFWWAKVPFA